MPVCFIPLPRTVGDGRIQRELIVVVPPKTGQFNYTTSYESILGKLLDIIPEMVKKGGFWRKIVEFVLIFRKIRLDALPVFQFNSTSFIMVT